MSLSPEGPANAAAEVVDTIAREAGLSPSLRAAVVEAAAGAAAATGEVSVGTIIDRCNSAKSGGEWVISRGSFC